MVFLEILASANYAGFRSDSHICQIKKNCQKEQVDILISKNQVIQIIYLKHHVCETSLIIMDKKPDEIHKNLNSTKIKQ